MSASLLKDFTGFGAPVGTDIRSAVTTSSKVALQTLEDLDVAKNALGGAQILQDLVTTDTSKSKRQSRVEEAKGNKAFSEWTNPFGKPCDPALGSIFCQQNTPEPIIPSLKDMRIARDERVEYYSDKITSMKSMMSELGILPDAAFSEEVPEKALNKVEKRDNKEERKSENSNLTKSERLQAEILALNEQYKNWINSYTTSSPEIYEVEWIELDPESSVEPTSSWSFDPRSIDPYNIFDHSTTPFPLLEIIDRREIFNALLEKTQNKSSQDVPKSEIQENKIEISKGEIRGDLDGLPDSLQTENDESIQKDEVSSRVEFQDAVIDFKPRDKISKNSNKAITAPKPVAPTNITKTTTTPKAETSKLETTTTTTSTAKSTTTKMLILSTTTTTTPKPTTTTTTPKPTTATTTEPQLTATTTTTSLKKLTTTTSTTTATTSTATTTRSETSRPSTSVLFLSPTTSTTSTGTPVTNADLDDITALITRPSLLPWINEQKSTKPYLIESPPNLHGLYGDCKSLAVWSDPKMQTYCCAALGIGCRFNENGSAAIPSARE